MAYPGLTARKADECAQRLREGLEPEPRAIESIEGADVDRTAIDAAARDGRALWEEYVTSLGRTPTYRDRWRLDPMMAPIVHAALRDLPAQVLDDLRFWRYLAIFPFSWFLRERRTDSEKYRPSDYGGGRQSPRNFLEGHYVLKAYRRGAIAYDSASDDHYERATRLQALGENDIDVWDSHFHKSKLGAFRDATHAIFDSVTEPEYFGLEETRQLAKLLTRERNNILFDVYGYDAARTMADSKHRLADELASKRKASETGVQEGE